MRPPEPMSGLCLKNYSRGTSFFFKMDDMDHLNQLFVGSRTTPCFVEGVGYPYRVSLERMMCVRRNCHVEKCHEYRDTHRDDADVKIHNILSHNLCPSKILDPLRCVHRKCAGWQYEMMGVG